MKFGFPSTLSTQIGNDTISLPDNGTIQRVDLQIGGTVGPTGAAIIVDILKSTDGGNTFSTIFTVGPGTNRPQIAAGALSGNTTTIDVSAVTKLTDLFKAQLAQVGSTIAGADISIMVRGQYNLD